MLSHHLCLAPGSYALESLLANEFRVRTLVCGDDEMIPSGPMYSDSIFQTCSITGAVKGQRFVSGAEYVSICNDLGLIF
jgi:ATP-binding cassette subfamily G (WHITE) protein 2 (SNQ2)